VTSSDICNLALGYLGTARIGTLGTDTSPQGVLCSAFYSTVKAALLEERNWTFAKKTWAATAGTAPTHAVWIASYAVPTDCIRVHRVDDGNGDYRIKWERVGAAILTDDSPTTLYVEGVNGAVTEAEFSSAFIFALATTLAAELCIPLTENATLWASLVKLAEMKLKVAAGSDGSQGKSEFLRSDSLAQRR
jgi:hypothetical protein